MDKNKEIAIKSMLECGYTYRAIKSELKVSSDSIQKIKQGIIQVDSKQVEVHNRERIERVLKRADYVLDKITDKDIEEASLRDKAIAASALFKAAHEMKASSNTVHNHLHLNGVMDRISQSTDSKSLDTFLKNSGLSNEKSQDCGKSEVIDVETQETTDKDCMQEKDYMQKNESDSKDCMQQNDDDQALGGDGGGRSA